MKPFDLRHFRENLAKAVATGIARLPQVVSGETLYAIALFTSGESEFCYVCLSANTEEALCRTAARYARKDADYRGDVGLRRLRWSTPDWGYHDFDKGVGALALPSQESKRPPGFDAKLYRIFVDVLRAAGRTGSPGAGKRGKILFNIVCGDMSEGFFRKGLALLNPPEVVRGYLQEWTAEPFIREINRLPAANRLKTWLTLYQDLSLGIRSDLSDRARLLDISEYDVQEEIRRCGRQAVPLLIDLIERHACARNTGDQKVNYPGANLTSGAAFMIASLGGIQEEGILRLVEVVRKRVGMDRKLRIAPTIAENVARVLHELFPQRFPETQLDPNTNKLNNAEAFLAGEAARE